MRLSTLWKMKTLGGVYNAGFENLSILDIAKKLIEKLAQKLKS